MQSELRLLVAFFSEAGWGHLLKSSLGTGLIVCREERNQRVLFWALWLMQEKGSRGALDPWLASLRTVSAQGWIGSSSWASKEGYDCPKLWGPERWSHEWEGLVTIPRGAPHQNSGRFWIFRMWRLNFQDRGTRDTARSQSKAQGNFTWIAAGPAVRHPSASGSIRNEVPLEEGPWDKHAPG